MRSRMAGLPAHLPPALLLPAPLALFARQPIGGRRFGGVGRVLIAQRQFPLQICDLLLGVCDLLLLLGNLSLTFRYLLTEFLVLSAQALIHTSTRREIRQGDLYILDIFPAPALYFGDTCRTFSVGEATDLQFR